MHKPLVSILVLLQLMLILIMHSFAKPHSSVGSVADFRTGVRWFDPRLAQYSFRGLMIAICDRIHFSLTAVRCFDNDYVGKQPVAWKEYCAEYRLKELQESMDRCTGRRDVTEILLKTALNTIRAINQSNIPTRRHVLSKFKSQ